MQRRLVIELERASIKVNLSWRVLVPGGACGPLVKPLLFVIICMSLELS